jgi:hypothetical protein
MILGSCVFTLNPIFKFDGYWVIADALGITNLSLQPTRIFRYFLDKLLRKPVQPLPWASWIIAILSIYTIFSFFIWGYFLWIILPLFWTSLLKYPDLISTVIPNLFQWPPILIKTQIEDFLGSTFIVIIGTLMLSNLAKKIPFNKLKKTTKKMKTFEYFKMASQTLLSKKLRSSLTMLGIIIGNASVITLIGDSTANTLHKNHYLQ